MRRFTALLLFGLVACRAKTLGDPCDKDDQCASAGGYCARVEVCTKACAQANAGECPEGTKCVAMGPSNVCLRDCGQTRASLIADGLAEPCNEDETCANVDGAQVCVAPVLAPSRFE